LGAFGGDDRALLDGGFGMFRPWLLNVKYRT